MSRIESVFKELKKQEDKALVSFITAGDPHPDLTVTLMQALVESGTDIIELGVPFSDPMAEGPVIQAACERALIHKVNLPKIFSIVAEFRKTDKKTPVILMGYLNPVEIMGYAVFVEQAASAGVDGVLIVDLPPEEADDLCSAAKQHGMDTIFLVAPTSTPERIKKICEHSTGFVYYVSMKGVTGASHLDIDSVKSKVSDIKSATSLPVGVGFGIKDAESASAIASTADAIVVGSAIVSIIGDNQDNPEKMVSDMSNLVKEIRQAIKTQSVNAVAE